MDLDAMDKKAYAESPLDKEFDPPANSSEKTGRID